MSETRYDPERGMTWLKVGDALDSQHVIVRPLGSPHEGRISRELWIQWELREPLEEVEQTRLDALAPRKSR